eukprot:TRINITY_DN306_c0_g1_i1.p1 TRINITY_DN306_c0_g1~~TRINITY_DN306_c0_g1_i1.p1  ORF type:complete len:245 (+),score=104.65 TRINITY_DN306_c0_g1_i1:40-774(+)
MLARCALRALQGNNKSAALCLVRLNSDVAAAGERDLVNFPPRKRPIDPSPVRMMVFPEEWFHAFYNKTGVSGPYMAFASIGTFLASKEYFVMEHDFYVGVALAIVLTGIVKKIGPSTAEWMEAEQVKIEKELTSIKQNEIDNLQAAIDSELGAQSDGKVWKEIAEAKKEAVGLQLEAAYRQRLSEAYTQVKKRLDYQLEVSNVVRRVEQKHMVDWIINNVKKSITPAQEEAALKKCIADLKALA